jgi:DNA-binding CsgD family transcriptional regulator
MWLRDYDHDRADIYAAIAQLRLRGELAMLPKIVKLRARADANAGHWDAAWLGYAEAVELARITGQTSMHGDALSGLAEIAAYRGQEDLCHLYAGQAQVIAAERSLGWNASHRNFEAATLALSVGRFAEAVDLLGVLADRHLAHGRTRLGAAYLPDLVEALIRVGRPEDAAARAGTYCRAMATETNPAEDALSCRLRALVAERDEDATSMFEAAIAAHRKAAGTFALARTQLLFGERLRRAGHRRGAREQLRAAARTFAEYRASPWRERAEAELAATGLARRPMRAAVSEELTPQELRVALLVADGLTNREAAEQMYLSVKTIEFHLGRVYQKYGVRSRMQLAERLRAG